MRTSGFALLLKRAMGLDVETIGASAIERAVTQRAQACGLKSAEEYWEVVGTSPAEVQALIETVVVPETWFFRDREAFTQLRQTVLPEWRRKHHPEALRVLSLPCSTGEEPYTIAMTLLESGLAPPQFSVDAVDISRALLDHARRAVFGRNSFRDSELSFRARFFHETAEGHRLIDVVRRQVNFSAGNLLDPACLAGRNYDVVFCRSLLIYFDRETQQRALQVIDRLLQEEGFLFVSASEVGAVQHPRFAPLRVPFAGAFRKLGRLTHAPTRTGGRPSEGKTRNAAKLTLAPVHSAGPTSVGAADPAAAGELVSPEKTANDTAVTPPNTTFDCWNKIGVWGRGDCPELQKHVHCRSCPVFSSAAARLLDAEAPEDYLREWTKTFAAENKKADLAESSIVVFRIGPEWLGLPTRIFQEVAESRVVHSLPHREHTAVLGLVNSRGELLICASLEKLLGIDRTTEATPPVGRTVYQRLLVVSREGQRFVFPVSEVFGIRRYHEGATREAPATLVKKVSFTRHLLRCDDKMVGCLDDELVFQALNRSLA